MTRAKSDSAGPGKGRPAKGRPAGLSRAEILDAAVSLLEAGNGAQISLNAIARSMKIAPMTIYTYFASKDELFQALSERLLSDFALELSASRDPYQVILAWANAMRAHLLARPQLIEFLSWEGGHASVGWIERGRVVADALSDLGLKGETRMQALLWVWQAVMGAIHLELRSRQVPLEMKPGDLDQLGARAREVVDELTALTARTDQPDRFFAFQLERMIDGLRLLAPKI